MQRIKKGDDVIVLAGKDKGKRGTVTKMVADSKLVVEGVNMVKKAIRPTQENPTGGIVDVESALHISNVAVVSPKTGKASTFYCPIHFIIKRLFTKKFSRAPSYNNKSQVFLFLCLLP